MIAERIVEEFLRNPAGDHPAIAVGSGPVATDMPRCIAALANRPMGGLLVLPADRRILTESAFRKELERAARRCSPPLSLRVLRGAGWVAAHIAPAPGPARSGEETPVLVDGSVRSADPADLAGIRDARGDATFEHVASAPPEIDEQLAAALGLADRDAWHAGALATMDHRVTVAGSWLVGRGDHGLPACTIKLERYLATMEDASGRSAPRGVTLAYGPPAAEAVDLLSLQIAADLTRKVVRRSHPLPSAVRELLANAIAHRSYAPAFSSRAILVRQYTNAVAIDSPGCLPMGHVTFADGRVVGSWSRNLALTSLLGRVGAARQQGNGLSVADRLARESGYRLSLDPREDRVIVVLRVAPPPGLAEGTATRQRLPRHVRQERIVELLARMREATAQQIAEALDIPAPTIRADLLDLSRRDVVEQTASAARSPHQTYLLRRDR
jgi:hypothetical protein